MSWISRFPSGATYQRLARLGASDIAVDSEAATPIFGNVTAWDASSPGARPTDARDAMMSDLARLDGEGVEWAPAVGEAELREFSVEQRVVNAAFLMMAFGYVLWTVLSIDQGMTRGWTGGEIAMRVPLDNWGACE